MKEKGVLVTLDWAMKFLPRKYREGSVDWFAKRGLNWHICVTMKVKRHFESVTHIFNQDAASTMTDAVKDLQQMAPNASIL